MKPLLVYGLGIATAAALVYLLSPRRKPEPAWQTWTSKDGVTLSWWPGEWEQA